MDKKPHTSESYALITGAASGMGREYARKLYALGHNLILVDKNEEGLSTIQGELSQIDTHRSDIIAITKDLSKIEAADEVYEAVKEKRVDILINNAGVMLYNSVTDTEIERTSGMQILHNYTLVRFCAHFAPKMKERGFGYILNISSLTAWMPYPGLAMYAATKRFNKSFSRSLRVELMGTGVSVTTAYFGGVSTNLFELSKKYRKLAIKLRILITAEKAARRALNAMFRKRANVMPGAINWIALPFLLAMPNRLLHFLDERYGVLIKK